MAGAPLVPLGGADQGIYRRGDTFAVRYRDENGRERQRAARSITEARKLRIQLVADVHAGRHRGVSREKVSEYALDWVERYAGRRGEFRELTRQEYRADLNRYLLPQLGGMRMTEVTPRHIARWVAWLADERAQGDRARAEAKAAGKKPKPGGVFLADGTIASIVTVARAMFSTALHEEVIATNPTRDVKLPKRDEHRLLAAGMDPADHKKARALSTDELATFLACVPDRYRLLIRLLASSGLRISEALALRWRDLELFGDATVTVIRRHRRDGFGKTKSPTSKRTVPIPTGLAVDLSRARRASEWHRDDDLVFCTRDGLPIDQTNLRRSALVPARDESGIGWQGFGFHTFRHTYATRLLYAGRNIVQVSKLLGHSSPKITLDKYAHVLNDDLGGALDEVKPSLGSARGQRDATKHAETAEAA